MSKLNPLGEWYKLVKSCDCGSERPYLRWHRDREGKAIFRVCEQCEERRTREYDEKTSSEEAGKEG